MDREKAKKANELIEEIDGLKEFKNWSSGFHIECVEHYGGDAKRIRVDRRHNPKFIDGLDKIINELEQELLDL